MATNQPAQPPSPLVVLAALVGFFGGASLICCGCPCAMVAFGPKPTPEEMQAYAEARVKAAQEEQKARVQKDAEDAKQKADEEIRKLAEAKQKKEQEEAQRQARERAQQKNLDEFTALLESLNANKLVTRVSVGGDNGERATITVSDEWHISAYQLRLQAAQNLWKLWASIASPNDVDRARIKIVDQNGNEVGGSRILAGSLIWVQKE